MPNDAMPDDLAMPNDAAPDDATPDDASPVLGLRTVIYSVPDLDAAKAWYAAAFGVAPYFDKPFYVGFNVGGYELGLSPVDAEGDTPAPPGPGGGVAYWGVADLDAAYAHVLEAGTASVEPIADVGGGIRVAVVADPFGNLVGLIENPHVDPEVDPEAAE